MEVNNLDQPQRENLSSNNDQAVQGQTTDKMKFVELMSLMLR